LLVSHREQLRFGLKELYYALLIHSLSNEVVSEQYIPIKINYVRFFE
jgi:hypothetical protein